MIFEMDRRELRRMVEASEDDRQAKEVKWKIYYRIEAGESAVKVSGRQAEAEFPAKVLEPGVMFLVSEMYRAAFDRLLREVKSDAVRVQASNVTLLIGDVRIQLAAGAMLLFADPKQAPAIHPQERCAREKALQDRIAELEKSIKAAEAEMGRLEKELHRLREAPRD